MTNETILDAIGGINEEAVRNAKAYKRPKSQRWIRWGAMAACLCLIACIAIPVLNKKAGTDNIDTVLNIATFEFDGRFYEAVNDPTILEKYGLPSEITEDMAGNHISYLKSDGGTYYEYTGDETDIELYQYNPTACDGVYALRDGDVWYAALFCNFYQADSNASHSFTELYRVYGIESADDIASITEMGDNNEKEISNSVDGQSEIIEFYNMTVSLESYGNDDFQAELFGAVSEEKQQDAHVAFADNRRILRIETKSGLRFFISFYPDYSWIYGGGTMSYFKIDSQMYDWIAKNLS